MEENEIKMKKNISSIKYHAVRRGAISLGVVLTSEEASDTLILVTLQLCTLSPIFNESRLIIRLS